MEVNPDEAVLNNIIGTQNVLTAALDYGTQKVVCISSDKAVNPSSVMGCCKRVTELLVRSPRFSRSRLRGALRQRDGQPRAASFRSSRNKSPKAGRSRSPIRISRATS